MCKTLTGDSYIWNTWVYKFAPSYMLKFKPIGNLDKFSYRINFLCICLIAGSYCPTGSSQPIGCEPGQYQNNMGKWSCDPCPAGYYCVNSTDPDPKPCTPYHYCPGGSYEPTQCPDGTVNNDTMKAAVNECLPCPTGKYCRFDFITCVPEKRLP